MKIFLIIFLFLFSLKVYPQSIFTLSCIDSSDSNNQFIISIDESRNKVFTGNHFFSNASISKEAIVYSENINNSVYTTIIYRSTGRYRVTISNSNYYFGGTCSKVISNKF